ncbi:hypothetical protein A2911_02650 [Candidatus Nomurabacteria bacterium RIFCSPLOWO2_01_FULL_40_15]|uniref:Uncharacterized protein n=1 Tax=Candidatus Nomurabacteria bacterium RIFCSPLOWO2_01_FULL_40_15 TaxID=1801772 RepID=A0A1F6X654_9BACT|nr:MAG: hypothetical protein A2911_02650 [Candidatus Nomurabacteria bacterium RIFCSPLOWO2_01_FULL_40_15]
MPLDPAARLVNARLGSIHEPGPLLSLPVEVSSNGPHRLSHLLEPPLEGETRLEAERHELMTAGRIAGMLRNPAAGEKSGALYF